jgi:hypothetical protein
VRIEGRLRPAFHLSGDVEAVVAATRLAAWPEHFKRDPVALVRLALRSGGSRLVTGWMAAAVDQGDAGWAEALIEGGAPATAPLLRVLPPQTADRVLVSLLQEWPLTRSVEVLLQRPRPWSPTLTGAVLASLRSAITGGDMTGVAAVRDALPAFALAFDPQQIGAAAALPDAVEGCRPAARTFWAKRISDLLAVLHFRHALHQEFR